MVNFGGIVMRVFTGVFGLVMVSMLGGCAGSVGMPSMGLWGDAADDASATQQAAAAPAPAVIPPVPSRNPKKPKTAASSRTQLAGAAPAAQKSPTPQTEAEEKPQSFLALMNPFGGGDTPGASGNAQSDASPTATYTMLAQQIHACWLTPGAPKLPNHGFHAEVAPGGQGNAKIIIYEKAADGRRGTPVFRISITGGSTSAITSENYRLDAKLDATFKSDIARWVKGDNGCKR